MHLGLILQASLLFAMNSNSSRRMCDTTNSKQQLVLAGSRGGEHNDNDNDDPPPSITLDGGVMVVGLNPALQKRFIMMGSTNLVAGNVHRAQRIEEGIGGKGQDVAVAFSCLLRRQRDNNNNNNKDESPSLVPPFFLAQFVGKGPDGDNVLKLLEKRIGKKMLYACHDDDDTTSFCLTVRTRSKLRTCTTIVASDSATELVEPSGLVEKDETNHLLNLVDRLAVTSSNRRPTLRSFCIMGSMPPGCPMHTYADLANLAVGPDTLVLIDSVLGLEPLLEELARIGTKSAMLKVNLSELSNLVMMTIASKNDSATTTTTTTTIHAEQHVLTLVRSFLNEFQHARKALSHVAITNGKDDAYLVSIERSNDDDDTARITDNKDSIRNSIWKIPVPKLPENRRVFPIGAGDTVSAGVLASWMYFKRSNNTNDAFLKDTICNAIHSIAPNYHSSLGGEVACALSFGLACASASCLQSENSVFDVEDAICLFSKMAKPTMVTNSIP